MLFKGGGVWSDMLEPRGNGTAAQPIAFGAYGSGRPVLDGAAARGDDFAGISLGRDYVSVTGFELRNWHGPLVYLMSSTGARFTDLYGHHSDEGIHPTPSQATRAVTVEGSRFESIGKGASGSGINLPSSASDWVVRDTRIAGAADSCIIDQGARSQYLRLQVSGCGFGGYTYGTHGMYLKGPGQSVVDSEVSDSYDSCISVRFQDAVVSGNRVHGCPEGISWYEYATANGTVRLMRNRIWDTGTAIYLDGSTTQNFLLANNTILGGRLAGGSSMGISVRRSRGLTIENTIVTGAISTALQTVPQGAPAIASATTSGGRRAACASAGTAAQRTLDAYRTASGQGAASASFDPQLRSALPAAPDFSLAPASAARDIGVRDPAAGALTPGCSGLPTQFCGAAPEPGALELLDGSAAAALSSP